MLQCRTLSLRQTLGVYAVRGSTGSGGISAAAAAEARLGVRHDSHCCQAMEPQVTEKSRGKRQLCVAWVGELRC